MAIINEKYSTSRINMIYQMLRNEAEQGQPKEYDISVDELKVISRSNDPERFFQHEDFVQPETRNITICLYDGSSRRCTRYVLLMKEEPVAKNALDGIEHTINEKLQQERRQWEYEQLRTENQELKQQIEDAEEYQDGLLQTIKQLEEQKGTTSSRITETILNLAGMYFAKNPQVLNGIPVLGELASSGSFSSQASQGTATYSKQDPSPDFAGNGTRKPEEKDVAALRSVLGAFFTIEQVEKVEQIIHYLYCNDHLADELLQMFQKADARQDEEGEAARREDVFSKAV